jgi:anti-sigma B factor antagonist
MEIVHRQENDVVIIDIPHRLTTETSDALKKLLKDLVDNNQNKLIMNLAETTYMDSSGLGAIVSKIAAARAGKGDIRLAAPKEYVLNLLELTHIDQIIKIFDNVNTAIESFGKE